MDDVSKKPEPAQGSLRSLFEVHFANYYADRKYLEIFVRTLPPKPKENTRKIDLIGFWRFKASERKNIERKVTEYCRILPEKIANDKNAILAFTLSFAERSQSPIYVKENRAGQVYAATYIEKIPVQVSKVLCEFQNYHIMQVPISYRVEGFTHMPRTRERIAYTSSPRSIQVAGFVLPSVTSNDAHV